MASTPATTTTFTATLAAAAVSATGSAVASILGTAALAVTATLASVRGLIFSSHYHYSVDRAPPKPGVDCPRAPETALLIVKTQGNAMLPASCCVCMRLGDRAARAVRDFVAAAAAAAALGGPSAGGGRRGGGGDGVGGVDADTHMNAPRKAMLDGPPPAAPAAPDFTLPITIEFPNNNFSDVGASLIAGAVAQDTELDSLTLCVSTMGAVGLEAVANAARGHPSLTKLALLGLRRDAHPSLRPVADTLLDARSDAKLASLCLSCDGALPDDWDALCAAIKASASVRFLSFTSDEFGPAHAATLAPALHALTTLSLGIPRDDVETAVRLAIGVAAARALRHLEITHCRVPVRDKGAFRRPVAVVLKALANHLAVESIVFSSMRPRQGVKSLVDPEEDDNDDDDGGDDQSCAGVGGSALGRAIEAMLSYPASRLRVLKVDVPFTAADARRMTAGLARNQTLQELFMEDSAMPPSAAAPLASAIQTHPTLQVIAVPNNAFDHAGVVAIVRAAALATADPNLRHASSLPSSLLLYHPPVTCLHTIDIRPASYEARNASALVDCVVAVANLIPRLRLRSLHFLPVRATAPDSIAIHSRLPIPARALDNMYTGVAAEGYWLHESDLFDWFPPDTPRARVVVKAVLERDAIGRIAPPAVGGEAASRRRGGVAGRRAWVRRFDDAAFYGACVAYLRDAEARNAAAAVVVVE
ncbi:hypothetical protein DFJ73DRAFT_959259 [Zopfochytrium polystomum]|nr:hypothetical protein DFJ73DRAFT_959259 [Zopfochytrium polystomum]